MLWIKRNRFWLSWLVPLFAVIANGYRIAFTPFHFGIELYAFLFTVACWSVPLFVISAYKKRWFYLLPLMSCPLAILAYWPADQLSAVTQRAAFNIYREPLERLASSIDEDKDFDPPLRIGPFVFRSAWRYKTHVSLVFPSISNEKYPAGLSFGDGCGVDWFGGRSTCKELAPNWKSFRE